MDIAKKELVVNLCLLSLVLSILNGALVVNINHSLVSDTPYVSGPGDFVVFVFFFLILYGFHAVVSFLQFAIAAFARRSLTRLAAFNTAGLALVGAIYVYIQDVTVLFLFSSLGIFSLVTAVINRK
ncbi:hypothetical protein M3647_33185 [Paenibacillus cellulositrophicus]|uniref:hypothetical protein n=1 Tax=Paenibacillus cellulositrophicus TaxID=562959 RepID=UPI00203E16F9|nr:hypothetical protein [Paenibacillus cellulositrophicus]MCM3002338.1 hypothetical protein [Paenibacillus cellulositrophicus]